MRYFFDQDDSGHWYMLPEELRDTWNRLSQMSNGWEYDGWQQIEDCRLNGGISQITFEAPSGDGLED